MTGILHEGQRSISGVFLVSFLRCEVEGEKVVMRLKSCQQTNVKKWSQALC